MNDSLIWAVRAFVYDHFAATARAPDLEAVARHAGLTLEQAGEILAALHDRHALFLEPGTRLIRQASPFSAIRTSFEVEVNGRTYRANCAWDCFGVAAAEDATIRSACAHTGQALQLGVRQGRVVEAGQVVIHFLVPFRWWYEDIIFT
jgi:hypothetical protein